MSEGIAHAAEAVAGDLACIGCGYNLRTMPVGGKCPECGVGVGETLGDRGERDRRLRRLFCGAGVLMGAGILWGIFRLVFMAVGAIDAHAMLVIGNVVQDFCMAMVSVGTVSLAASRRPRRGQWPVVFCLGLIVVSIIWGWINAALMWPPGFSIGMFYGLLVSGFLDVMGVGALLIAMEFSRRITREFGMVRLRVWLTAGFGMLLVFHGIGILTNLWVALDASVVVGAAGPAIARVSKALEPYEGWRDWNGWLGWGYQGVWFGIWMAMMRGASATRRR